MITIIVLKILAMIPKDVLMLKLIVMPMISVANLHAIVLLDVIIGILIAMTTILVLWIAVILNHLNVNTRKLNAMITTLVLLKYVIETLDIVNIPKFPVKIKTLVLMMVVIVILDVITMRSTVTMMMNVHLTLVMNQVDANMNL